MKTHDLKLLDLYANDVLSGKKSFEIRYNDRNYSVGDLIKFHVIDSQSKELLDHPLNYLKFEIVFLIDSFGLQEGYCVFSIRRV